MQNVKYSLLDHTKKVGSTLLLSKQFILIIFLAMPTIYLLYERSTTTVPTEKIIIKQNCPNKTFERTDNIRLFLLESELLDATLNKNAQQSPIEITKELLTDKLNFDMYAKFLSEHEYLFRYKTIKETQILLKMLKFISMDVDEYDDGLVEFVRELIVAPPDKNVPLNLDFDMIDYSQSGQSKYMDKLMGEKRNGFFIESGAHNGEELSNSLYFERQRNWTGLLIEPLSNSFREVLSKNRKVYALNACLAKRKPTLLKFRFSNVYSSRLDYINKDQLDYIDELANRTSFELVDVYVPCFSLNTILTALNVKQVDMFSLDVEGSEWDVMQTIDYDKFNIDLICYEHVYVNQYNKEINEKLSQNGFKLVSNTSVDAYYQKKSARSSLI